MAVIVTLDVYSGRPNPNWALSDDRVQELQRRIGATTSRAGALGGSLRCSAIAGSRSDRRNPSTHPLRGWRGSRRATPDRKNPCCPEHRKRRNFS